jgi:hypothetical protein
VAQTLKLCEPGLYSHLARHTILRRFYDAELTVQAKCKSLSDTPVAAKSRRISPPRTKQKMEIES